MVEFIQANLTTLVLSAMGLCAAAAAYDSRAYLATLLPSPKKAEAVKPTRAKAAEAIVYGFDYFYSINCKEGMEAMKVANQHVLEHGEQA